jgi:hypothetical protein
MHAQRRNIPEAPAGRTRLTVHTPFCGNLPLDQSTTGLTQAVTRKHSRDLPMGITDRAMEAWYHPSIA